MPPNSWEHIKRSGYPCQVTIKPRISVTPKLDSYENEEDASEILVAGSTATLKPNAFSLRMSFGR
jgi:hypothetical protein